MNATGPDTPCLPPLPSPAAAPSVVSAPVRCSVFLDFQNFHFLLRDRCGVASKAIHLPLLLRDWLHSHNMKLHDIRLYTGVHDPAREPDKAEAMSRRLGWLERQGVHVFTSLLHYREEPDGTVRAHEKGIDVRMACELVQAVACDGATHVVLITQDSDLIQAVSVAREIAAARGAEFHAYSLALSNDQALSWEVASHARTAHQGVRGLAFTERLGLDVAFVRQHADENAQRFIDEIARRSDMPPPRSHRTQPTVDTEPVSSTLDCIAPLGRP